jgi:hypothetical protein
MKTNGIQIGPGPMGIILLFLAIKERTNFIVSKEYLSVINTHTHSQLRQLKFEPLSGRPLLQQNFILDTDKDLKRGKEICAKFKEVRKERQHEPELKDFIPNYVENIFKNLICAASNDPVIAFYVYSNQEIFLMDVSRLFPALILYEDSKSIFAESGNEQKITEKVILDSLPYIKRSGFNVNLIHSTKPVENYYKYRLNYFYIKDKTLLYIHADGSPQEIRIKNLTKFNEKLAMIIKKASLLADTEIFYVPIWGDLLPRLLGENADDYEIELQNKMVQNLLRFSSLTSKISFQGWNSIVNSLSVNSGLFQKIQECDAVKNNPESLLLKKKQNPEPRSLPIRKESKCLIS